MEEENLNPGPKSKKARIVTSTDEDFFNAGLATAAIVGIGVILFRSNLLPGMLLGVGSMMAPRIFPDLEPALKPLVKSMLRAGSAAAERAKEVAAEASEQFEDLVAEIRHEDQMASNNGNAKEG